MEHMLPLLPLDRYLLPLTLLNRYLMRGSIEKLFNTDYTWECTMYLLLDSKSVEAILLLDFVGIYWIRWIQLKSVKDSSIHIFPENNTVKRVSYNFSLHFTIHLHFEKNYCCRITVIRHNVLKALQNQTKVFLFFETRPSTFVSRRKFRGNHFRLVLLKLSLKFIKLIAFSCCFLV